MGYNNNKENIIKLKDPFKSYKFYFDGKRW